MPDLKSLQSRALAELDGASNEAALEAWRLAYLGRQGVVTQLLRGLGELPVEERRSAGAGANALRAVLEDALNLRQTRIEEAAMAKLESGGIDVSLPGRTPLVGRLHPISQTIRDMLAIVGAMGFQVTEGPEVEYEYYNFDALRMGKDHPARDTQDTFWMDEKRDGERFVLLRTQTSPNQIRFMEKRQPPIRVAVPGRVYRYENTDASHEWMFHQIELLAVDEGLSMRHLRGAMTQIMQGIFGKDRPVRFRNHYFPFVEPGAEVDIQCDLCRGAGCRSCGNEGWLEVCGCGMVHREILENVGYDGERYTGFAVGFGVERIAMLRHSIDDMRHFFNNDLRFLRQF